MKASAVPADIEEKSNYYGQINEKRHYRPDYRG